MASYRCDENMKGKLKVLGLVAIAFCAGWSYCLVKIASAVVNRPDEFEQTLMPAIESAKEL